VPRTVAVLICLLGLAFLVVACTGGGAKSASTGGAAGPAGRAAVGSGAGTVNGYASTGDANPASVPQGAPAKPAVSPLLQRDVVRTADVDVQVSRVDSAADTIVAFTTTAGGRVDGDDRLSTNDKGGKAIRTATLTLRLPPARLDDVLAKSVKLGTETSRTMKGEDVTASRADIDARVTALTASVDRLTKFLQNANSVKDVVALESDLSQRQAQLESTVAQQRALSDEIDLSTLTVHLSEPPVLAAPVKASHGPFGFGKAVARGWHALVVSFRWVAAGIGYALPFLVLLAAAAVSAGYALRRRITPEAPEPAAPSGAATP
jgi:hypothetical protein